MVLETQQFSWPPFDLGKSFEEYLESLKKPLPGHTGADGKIIPGLESEEVKNRMATVLWARSSGEEKYARQIIDVLRELYSDQTELINELLNQT